MRLAGRGTFESTNCDGVVRQPAQSVIEYGDADHGHTMRATRNVVTIFAGMGDLPLFNPDLEWREPSQVARLRTDIADADALLIASPEYAHGVSGVMKNALDWIVASGVLMNKPIALWNASPRASHAMAALRETLAVMAARLVDVAGLELLIGHDSVGRPLPNPDDAAMRRALLAIKADLGQKGRSSSS